MNETKQPKIVQFVLTCVESKQYRETGRCVHSYGGIGYSIENHDGKPCVVGLVMLDPSKVDYEIIVRR